MNSYRLSDDQQQILARLKEIVDGPVAKHAATADATSSFPTQAMQALASGGFYGLSVPREFGGMGQGLRMGVAAVDAIAQECASTAMVYLMHLCGIAAYNARPTVAGDQLREAAKGNHLTTLAWSEKGSRSHFWAPISTAEAENGQIRITAEKSWVTSAKEADGYVVSTGRAGRESPMDTMLYLVLKGDPGLSVSGAWDAMGMRGNGSAPMCLHDTVIPAERALNDEGQGMNTMLGVVLPWFATGNAAVSIGISEGATQATANHLTASKLQHLGQSLADLPNLRARLAEMRIETDRGRMHLIGVLDALESGVPEATLWLLQAKAAGSQTALKVTDLAMKTCGGAAFSKHLGVERYFRDARAGDVMAPTTDVLHDFIGKALLGMELF